MRRYSIVLGSLSAGAETVAANLVIATTEVSHEEIIAAGFAEVSTALSDLEVMAAYGVSRIVIVGDRRIYRPRRAPPLD